jgi:hypothetical protein
MRLLAALLAASLAGQDDPLVREAARGWRHAWDGYPGGSTVRVRQTTKRPEISDAGQLVYKAEVQELSFTVLTPEGEKPMLEIRSGGQETHVPIFTALPSLFRGKAEEKGREEIAVGGRKYACSLTRIALDEGKDVSQVTMIAKAPDAPVWAVRVRVETLMGGVRNTLEEELLVAEDQKLKVGDKELNCAVVQVTTEAAGGGKTVKKEWRSDEVPGRVVRRELRQFLNDKEIEAAGSTMEVVSFRIIK